jgi:uncharacterized membrane protein
MARYWLPLVAVLALIGFADATYLAIMHFQNADVGCSVITGCDAVLSSEYAYLFGVPLAYLGVLYYLSVLIVAAAYYQFESTQILNGLLLILTGAFLFSLWLVFLQAFIIHAFCQFCLISASLTTAMFVLTVLAVRKWELRAEE